jgi:DNA-binding transcriptional ArsR family regulator
LTVHPSIAVELDWALSASCRVDGTSTPPLLQLYRDSPALAERVRGLWGPDETMSYPGFLELSILAHNGGVLFTTDSEEFPGRLEELAAGATPDGLVLQSETDEDRLKLLRRLDLLRSDAERRRRYAEVVTEVWAALRPYWERVGYRAVASAVADRQALIARGAPWPEFAHNECGCHDRLEVLVAALPPGGELAVVPAFFTHKGMFVDLPGVVIVGVRTDPSGPDARARTELLARRLRAVADPTRLAILDALSRSHLTVTDLAAMFSLAQPTVSNHIKVLRDAGFVSSSFDGRRRNLAVRHDVVAEVLESLQRTLMLADAPAPAEAGS